MKYDHLQEVNGVIAASSAQIASLNWKRIPYEIESIYSVGLPINANYQQHWTSASTDTSSRTKVKQEQSFEVNDCSFKLRFVCS